MSAAPRRADLGDERGDLGGDLVGAEPLRQIAFEHLQLGLLLVDQVLAAAGRELLDRVLALLDELVDDRDDRGVVEDDALVDLALLDRGEQAADRRAGAARPWRAWPSSCRR